jgi:hypothetical protein
MCLSYHDCAWAVITKSGIHQWRYNGSFHRADDKPAVICPESIPSWYYGDVGYDDTIFFKNSREW